MKFQIPEIKRKFKDNDIHPRILYQVKQSRARGWGGKIDSDKQRQKKTLPLCTVYEEAFEGLVPFLKRANKKGNGSNTEGSEGNYQGEGGVLSNIDSHATG